MAILPIGTEEIEFYSVELLYNGLIIETNEKININEFQKNVLKVTEGKGYSYYVTNPNKLLENEKQGIDNMSYPLLLSGTVLFFISIYCININGDFIWRVKIFLLNQR